MAESEEEPVDEGERGEWKSCLKLNIKKAKVMVSSPITSWHVNEETMETVTLFSWTPKSQQTVTAAM